MEHGYRKCPSVMHSQQGAFESRSHVKHALSGDRDSDMGSRISEACW